MQRQSIARSRASLATCSRGPDSLHEASIPEANLSTAARKVDEVPLNDATVGNPLASATLLKDAPLGDEQPNKTLPPMLRLPAELRNRIYADALVDSQDVMIRSGDHSPPLLQTCQQIRNETFKLYYSSNTFKFAIPRHTNVARRARKISWWLQAIGPLARRELRAIHISPMYMDHNLAAKVLVQYYNVLREAGCELEDGVLRVYVKDDKGEWVYSSSPLGWFL